MATLTRSKSESHRQEQSSSLASTIPTPFPLEDHARILGQHLSSQNVAFDDFKHPENPFRDDAYAAVEVQPVASSSNTTQVSPAP